MLFSDICLQTCHVSHLVLQNSAGTNVCKSKYNVFRNASENSQVTLPDLQKNEENVIIFGTDVTHLVINTQVK